MKSEKCLNLANGTLIIWSLLKLTKDLPNPAYYQTFPGKNRHQYEKWILHNNENDNGKHNDNRSSMQDSTENTLCLKMFCVWWHMDGVVYHKCFAGRRCRQLET